MKFNIEIIEKKCGKWQDLVNTDLALFPSHRTRWPPKKEKRRNSRQREFKHILRKKN